MAPGCDTACNADWEDITLLNVTNKRHEYRWTDESYRQAVSPSSHWDQTHYSHSLSLQAGHNTGKTPEDRSSCKSL